MTHPKLVGLSDKAFRLWVWGLSYSQQHLTDGMIPEAAVPPRLKRATHDLMDKRLWDTHDMGFKVHDYLDWNDSREVILAKREGGKNRYQRWTDKRIDPATPQRVSNAFDRLTSQTLPARSGVVLDPSLEKEFEEKPTDEALIERAGKLREELYPEWYARWRHGARLTLIPSQLELQHAVTLVRTWNDARLEKLAKIILTTDEPWISRTDRGFRIFALKASWADDRLREWEVANGVSA